MLGMAFCTIVIGVFSWGCAAIIASHYGIQLPLFHSALTMIVSLAGPPTLLLAASYSIFKVRFWRKMAELSAKSQLGNGTRLARGEPVSLQPLNTKSGLEYFLGWVIWLGIISLPYWLTLPSPEVWAGSALLVKLALVRAVPSRHQVGHPDDREAGNKARSS